MPRNCKLLAVTLVSLAACSSTGNSDKSSDKPTELIERSDSRYETVVILGTNDIHGALSAQKTKTRNDPAGSTPVEYTYGGAEWLASHVRSLEKRYGSRLVWLEGGDQFQGSIESNAEEGRAMVAFYNELGLDASAVGNHEFDFGPVGPEGSRGDELGALKQRLRQAKYPYLAANIVQASTGKPVQWPNTRASVLLNAGRLKVGVIGLSTLDTPTTTRPEFVRSLAFKPLAPAVKREAKELREAGADIVVITSHVGLRCKRDPGAYNLILEADDPGAECEGNSAGTGPSESRKLGEMVELLEDLPSGTVDAVVTGHSHQVIHHFVAGVPVIQGGTRAQAYNLVYLTYDLKEKRLVSDWTRIQGPVPVCPRVFSRLGHCDGSLPPPAGGRGKLVEARIDGKPVRPDPQMTRILAPVFDRTEKLKKTVIGRAARPIDHQRYAESELGNLVADALRKKLDADVAIMNSGGIRAPFDSGPITFEALFRSLPFDNFPSKLTVKGHQLRLMIRIAESRARGFFPLSGARVVVLPQDADAPSDDLNSDGKIDPWEVNRLVSLKLSDGSEIDDDQLYTVALPDFLANGGDDMGFVMQQIPPDRKDMVAGPVLRELVQDYIERQSPINTTARPLVQPGKPRIEVSSRSAGSQKGASTPPSPPVAGKPRYRKM